jgi:hypothetical protein
LETAPITSASFVPVNTSEWKQASASIPFAYLTSGFRFKFVFTSNGGNNVYLDDINLDIDAGINSLDNLGTTLQVFPNPATGLVNIGFTLVTSKKLDVSILNILGQPIYKSIKENYPSGQNALSINIKDVPAGIYFVKISDGITELNKPLIIATN